MPYYRVPAIITRTSVTNSGVTRTIPYCRPNFPRNQPYQGDTNFIPTQLAAADPTTFYVIATANPEAGFIPIATRALRIADIDLIAAAHGKNVTRARADSDAWETNLRLRIGART